MSDLFLRRPRSWVRRCPWRAPPAPGKSMQAPARLKAASQPSACLGKREWPWRAPAPVIHFRATGASKCPCRGPLSHCSRR
eukprot:1033671-Pyramimonas_sp.AAC.1